MPLTFDILYNYTERNVKRALGKMEFIKESTASKIDFPGYTRMRPGDYREAWFTTLFLDIRGSTKRAFEIGPQNTFVTIHALLPTLARIVGELDGFVVDYPGDGIMAHWELDDNKDADSVRNCVKAACWMDDAVKTIVNPILNKYNIPSLVCGIGVAAGQVIVTKIGISEFVSAKAIGDSVNIAAKLASSTLNSGSILLDKVMADFAYDEVAPSEAKSKVAFTYTGINDGVISISPNLNIPRPQKNEARTELQKLLQGYKL